MTWAFRQGCTGRLKIFWLAWVCIHSICFQSQIPINEQQRNQKETVWLASLNLACRETRQNHTVWGNKQKNSVICFLLFLPKKHQLVQIHTKSAFFCLNVPHTHWRAGEISCTLKSTRPSCGATFILFHRKKKIKRKIMPHTAISEWETNS